MHNQNTDSFPARATPDIGSLYRIKIRQGCITIVSGVLLDELYTHNPKYDVGVIRAFSYMDDIIMANSRTTTHHVE